MHERARQVLAKMGLEGEILVSDSSTDNTPELARSCGAKVIKPNKLGYGNAYLAGFAKASQSSTPSPMVGDTFVS